MRVKHQTCKKENTLPAFRFLRPRTVLKYSNLMQYVFGVAHPYPWRSRSPTVTKQHCVPAYLRTVGLAPVARQSPQLHPCTCTVQYSVSTSIPSNRILEFQITVQYSSRMSGRMWLNYSLESRDHSGLYQSGSLPHLLNPFSTYVVETRWIDCTYSRASRESRLVSSSQLNYSTTTAE